MHRLFLLRALVPFVFLVSCVTVLRAQESAVSAKPAAGLSSWEHVRNLPAKTKVHISMDHGSTTCHIFAVSEDALTCASGLSSNSAGKVIQRGTIKRIKRTRYGVSTVAGFGLGAGVGAAVGAASTKDDGFRSLGVAVFGVGGAIVGAAIGGATDFTRGPTVYVRP